MILFYTVFFNTIFAGIAGFSAFRRVRASFLARKICSIYKKGSVSRL